MMATVRICPQCNQPIAPEISLPRVKARIFETVSVTVVSTGTGAIVPTTPFADGGLVHLRPRPQLRLSDSASAES
jgi:hypothetical protein